MNIIFLDMDGVVNSISFFEEWQRLHGSGEKSLEEFRSRYCCPDGYAVPDLIGRVNSLAHDADAGIVWSSSWRERFLLPTTDDLFDEHRIRRCWESVGLDAGRFIGCTPCLNATRYSFVPRSVEIQRWIKVHDVVYNMDRAVILDDDPDAGVHHPRVLNVLTDMEFGLTAEKAGIARRWLLDDYDE